MNKPRGVKWLEDETRQVLDRVPPVREEGRHLSVRLPGNLVAELEQLAAERGETVSQATRRLITEGLARTSIPDRDAVDLAIAALERLRSRLNSPAA